MNVDNILDVTNEFVKRLSLPESRYKFVVTSNNEVVELVIIVENDVKCSLKITPGTISVLYTDDYNSKDYSLIEFQTPITFLYELCVLFYASVREVFALDFNKMLSVLLFEEVYDWKTLIYALGENLGFDVKIGEHGVDVEGVEIKYSGYLNKLVFDNIEINLEKEDYLTLVDACFKCVEYIANLADVADNLFQETNEEEVEEEPENVTEEGGGDLNLDVDIEAPEGGGEEEEMSVPEEAGPEQTFDQAEPEGAVTLDDLL